MNNFNKACKKIFENMTTGTVFGPGQAQPAEVGKSSDFYAPGDARNIWGTGVKKKKKKANKESVKVIRRTFPGM